MSSQEVENKNVKHVEVNKVTVHIRRIKDLRDMFLWSNDSKKVTVGNLKN